MVGMLGEMKLIKMKAELRKVEQLKFCSKCGSLMDLGDRANIKPLYTRTLHRCRNPRCRHEEPYIER